MWQLLKLGADNEWTALENTDDADKAKSLLSSKEGNANEQFYVLWTGEYPSDKSAIESLISQIFNLNPGKDLKVFPNNTVSISAEDSTCGCPSRCFCVWENGSCSCWTSYCNPNCIWVRCNGGC